MTSGPIKPTTNRWTNACVCVFVFVCACPCINLEESADSKSCLGESQWDGKF